MAKNKIRRKAAGGGPQIKATDHPDVFGFPVQPVQNELICIKCEGGVMRPSQSSLVTKDAKAGTMLHVCTNADCRNTVSLPLPPWPRPSFEEMIPLTDPNVFEMIKRFRAQRAEVMEQIQRAEAQGAKGVES